MYSEGAAATWMVLPPPAAIISLCGRAYLIEIFWSKVSSVFPLYSIKLYSETLKELHILQRGENIPFKRMAQIHYFHLTVIEQQFHPVAIQILCFPYF